jgi:hypothetical protein
MKRMIKFLLWRAAGAIAAKTASHFKSTIQPGADRHPFWTKIVRGTEYDARWNHGAQLPRHPI